MKIHDKGGLQSKLKELAELKDIQNVVKMNTSELQNKAMRNTSMFKKPTGNLKRNITISLENGGLTGKVTADVAYSAYVEYGTRYQSAQPFLRKAMFEQNYQFVQDLFRLMK